MVATLETEKRNWPFIIMVIVFFSVVFYFNVVLLSAQSRFIESCILQKDLLSILQIVIKINITPISVVTPIFFVYVLFFINAFTLYYTKIKNIFINFIVNIFIAVLFLISMFLLCISIYYVLFTWDCESREFSDGPSMFFIFIFIGLMCCAIFMLIVLDLLVRLFARLFIGKKAEG